MESLWSENIRAFNKSLSMEGVNLPRGVHVLNPFIGERADEIDRISNLFYSKFYNDSAERKLILGINPGRLGAGATGLPFTDTIRLEEFCGIKASGFKLYEPSSEFVYKVIDAYGGVESFYNSFYIGSVCPLGFTVQSKAGKEVNYNYYDDLKLQNAVEPFIINAIEKQLEFGINKSKVFCLGTGKNTKYLTGLNTKKKWFEEVVPLEHPRYVMQYKRKALDSYIDKFIRLLAEE